MECDFRDQALSASEMPDMQAAKQEIDELMERVHTAQISLDKVAKSTLDLKRDLAQANDRQLVLRAEKSSEMREEELLIAAHAHLRQERCRNKEGDLWPVWSTTTEDLEEYGTGISLYFRLTINLSMTLTAAAVLTLPFLVLNLTGQGLEDVDVGVGNGFFALSSIGNFLSANGTVSVSWVELDPANVSWCVGTLDAVAVAAVGILAIWFERKALPAAVEADAMTTVTPDAFSLYVSHLPRRLKKDHGRYEELLRQHFENQLSPDLVPQAAHPGVDVLRKEEQFLHEPQDLGCCSRFLCCLRRAKDYRGRRLGVIAKADEQRQTCEVQWVDEKGKLRPPATEPLRPPKESPNVDSPDSPETEGKEETLDETEISVDEDLEGPVLLQAELLKRLEDVDCAPPSAGRKAVFKVSLIRDFKGRLKQMRRLVERVEAKQDAAGDEKQMKEAEAYLENLKLEEQDVLGAFVTFDLVKFRDFVSQEYRFSRLALLGAWLQGPEQRFQGHAIQIHDAVLPNDIFWENIDCPKMSRSLRKLAMGIVFVMVLVVMIMGLSLAKWGREQAQQQTADCSLQTNATERSTLCECADLGIAKVLQDQPAGSRATCESFIKNFAFVQSMIIGAAVFSSVINLASGYLIAIFANFMQPPSRTVLECRIMEMTFVVQCLTLGVVVSLVNADFGFSLFGQRGIFNLIGAGDFQDIDKRWTAAVGVEILMLFIFSIATEAVAVGMVWWFNLSHSLCWKKTWKDVKLLYTPPEFQLGLQHASQLSAVCAALLYSSCLPVMKVILAFRLFAMYWSSKYELLRGSAVPKRFGHVLALAASQWVQVAVFAHSAVAVWVFGNPELTGTKVIQEATSYFSQVGQQINMGEAMAIRRRLDGA
ncbi:unnamed protein product [Effrenium voratum]|uniref:Uncharacterized protein n=1 Tax=Effrenium voratum TaxID=2562239 RepID=A0AA36NBJ8_9DINO|nr:unnamed protein product [Effrenium voratum]